MVLHTWTRELRFHPHVHALVTAGGLALDSSRWPRLARTRTEGVVLVIEYSEALSIAPTIALRAAISSAQRTRAALRLTHPRPQRDLEMPIA